MPFGAKQINQPTPSNIERNLKILVALSGGIITAVQSANFIPDNVGDIICWVLGVTITVCTILTPFFGVAVTPNEDVPVEDVTAMEQPK